MHLNNQVATEITIIHVVFFLWVYITVGVIASVAVVGMIVVAAVVHQYVRKNDKVELEVASVSVDTESVSTDTDT
mgnify:CR=1 FL=1